MPIYLIYKGKEWDPILNAKEKEEERLRLEFEAQEAKMYQKSKKQKFIPRNNYQHKVSLYIWTRL